MFMAPVIVVQSYQPTSGGTGFIIGQLLAIGFILACVLAVCVYDVIRKMRARHRKGQPMFQKMSKPTKPHGKIGSAWE